MNPMLLIQLEKEISTYFFKKQLITLTHCLRQKRYCKTVFRCLLLVQFYSFVNFLVNSISLPFCPIKI